MKQTAKAELYLLFVTVIWGVTFPLIRDALTNIDPNLFVALRFALAVLILLPFIWHKLPNTSRTILICSLIMGVLNSLSYLMQTLGLQTISASRSAFITGFSVVIVPLIAPLFKLGSLRSLDILCSIISVIGLYILTGANLDHITIGDKWTLLSTFAFALQIVYLQRVASKINDYELLAFYQLIFTVPLVAGLSSHGHLLSVLKINVLIALLFCAIFATTIAFFVQAKYQKFTTAPKAALIFSLEPVFASIFGYLINGDAFTKYTIFGGSLILLSLVIPNVLQLFKEKSNLPC